MAEIPNEDLEKIAEFYEIINNDIRMAYVSYKRLSSEIRKKLSFKEYMKIVLHKEELSRY